MLRCGSRTAADCLTDHVRPFLRQATQAGSGGDSYRAIATCHDDTDPSLSVSVRGGRVVWNCFAKCGSDKARNAMILLGVPAHCLIRPAADLGADMDVIRKIISGERSHAHKVLAIAALLAGHDRLPAGYALEDLAEGCGVSQREAYKARRAELHP